MRCAVQELSAAAVPMLSGMMERGGGAGRGIAALLFLL